MYVCMYIYICMYVYIYNIYTLQKMKYEYYTKLPQIL